MMCLVLLLFENANMSSLEKTPM